MDSEREFRENLRLPVTKVTRFKTPSCLIEAPAQRELFVGIAQFTQEPANFVCALMGGPDRPPRVVRGNRARQEALE